MTEMQKLMDILSNANVPFQTREIYGTIQVLYPNIEERICDAVCHRFSYGYEDGLLEIMGLVDVDEVGDTVEGWLTAEEVANRIIKHYHENN